MSITLLAEIEAIRSGETGWSRAARKLLIEGMPALHLLLRALEQEEKVARPVYTDPLHRLMDATAQFGDSQSLLSLLRITQWSKKTEPYALFQQALALVEAYPTERDIEPLTALLRMNPPTQDAHRIAILLVEMAERTPGPQFRATIASIHYRIGLPLEFISLRKRLKAALRDESLPIPAKNQSYNEALPLPAKETEAVEP